MEFRKTLASGLVLGITESSSQDGLLSRDFSTSAFMEFRKTLACFGYSFPYQVAEIRAVPFLVHAKMVAELSGVRIHRASQESFAHRNTTRVFNHSNGRCKALPLARADVAPALIGQASVHVGDIQRVRLNFPDNREVLRLEGPHTSCHFSNLHNVPAEQQLNRTTRSHATGRLTC